MVINVPNFEVMEPQEMPNGSRLLMFRDDDSNTTFIFPFTEENYELFKQMISGSQIITATAADMPKPPTERMN